jgi:hypothetical protein
MPAKDTPGAVPASESRPCKALTMWLCPPAVRLATEREERRQMSQSEQSGLGSLVIGALALIVLAGQASAQARPNVVMLITDDTG